MSWRRSDRVIKRAILETVGNCLKSTSLTAHCSVSWFWSFPRKIVIFDEEEEGTRLLKKVVVRSENRLARQMDWHFGQGARWGGATRKMNPPGFGVTQNWQTTLTEIHILANCWTGEPMTADVYCSVRLPRILICVCLYRLKFSME